MDRLDLTSAARMTCRSMTLPTGTRRQTIPETVSRSLISECRVGSWSVLLSLVWVKEPGRGTWQRCSLAGRREECSARGRRPAKHGSPRVPESGSNPRAPRRRTHGQPLGAAQGFSGREVVASVVTWRARSVDIPGGSDGPRHGSQSRQMFLRIPGIEIVLELGKHVRLNNVVVRSDLAGRRALDLLQAGEPSPFIGNTLGGEHRRRIPCHVEIDQRAIHRLPRLNFRWQPADRLEPLIDHGCLVFEKPQVLHCQGPSFNVRRSGRRSGRRAGATPCCMPPLSPRLPPRPWGRSGVGSDS